MMKKFLTPCVFLMFCNITFAQPNFGVEYITEFQTNFGNKYNWVNLLELSGELPSTSIHNRWKNGSFHAMLISTYRPFNDRVIDDLLYYSNITKERVPFNIFVLGYQHQWDRFSLFGGVRNLEEDYFTNPHKALFTNHSAGMIPTMALNFPIADLPVSAMCLHAELNLTENLHFKTSLYNGEAHNPREKPWAPFVADPRNDGVFSISQLKYSQNKILHGNYALGVTYHTTERHHTSFYGTIEQALFENEHYETGFFLQGGFSGLFCKVEHIYPPHCKTFFGAGWYFDGLLSKQKRDSFGMYFGVADFSYIKEHILEITWHYHFSEHIAIQPALHIVRTGNNTRSVGLLRFIASI